MKRKKHNKRSPIFLATVFFICLLALLFYRWQNPFQHKRLAHHPRHSRSVEYADCTDAFHVNDNAGLPAIGAKDEIVKHFAYTLCYNERHEVANWVAYTLKRSYIISKNKVQRTEDFRDDPAVKTGSARLEDYRHSGFDRGHLVPAGDMKWSAKAMSETFLLSNITPQNHAFNEGIWADLENQVRDWAVEDSILFVVTGPVLKGNMNKIGPDGVSVPRAFYKVILTVCPTVKAIGFIIPNEPGKQSFWRYAISVQEVEKETGLDFYHMLPDNIERQAEDHLDIKDWNPPRRY